MPARQCKRVHLVRIEHHEIPDRVRQITADGLRDAASDTRDAPIRLWIMGNFFGLLDVGNDCAPSERSCSGDVVMSSLRPVTGLVKQPARSPIARTPHVKPM